MTILVRNHTGYDTGAVRALVRDTLRDLGVDGVCVTVRNQLRGHNQEFVSGRYRSYWYPDRGEDRPQILVRLPRPDVTPGDYIPYRRKHAPARFPLLDWHEALIAIVAHEGMHHRQMPRNSYGTERTVTGRRRRGRYIEHECDWAAYRAVMRSRGKVL